MTRDAIEARLDAVAHLLQQTVVRGEIRKELRGIQDLERLTSRITLGLATAAGVGGTAQIAGAIAGAEEFPDAPSRQGGSELLRRISTGDR